MITNTNSHEFTLPFKGKREYIHGTDIIAYIEKTFENSKIKKFKIDFLDDISQNIIKIIKVENSIDEGVKIKAKFNINETKFHIVSIGENKNIPNLEYDEHLVTKGYTLSNKTIKLNKNKNFTEIEIIVALNKILLESIFNLRDFWFVNLEITLFPLFFNEVELRYNKSLFNKFHETKIYMDNNFVGHIRFQNKI